MHVSKAPAVTLTTTNGNRYCMHVNRAPAVTLTTTTGSRYCMHLSPWQQPIEIVIVCTWRNGKQPPEYLGLLLVSCYHCGSKPNGLLLLSVDTAASSYTVADFAVLYCTPPGVYWIVLLVRRCALCIVSYWIVYHRITSHHNALQSRQIRICVTRSSKWQVASGTVGSTPSSKPRFFPHSVPLDHHVVLYWLVD